MRRNEFGPAVQKLVWASMIFALAIYAFVAYFVTTQQRDVPPFRIDAAFGSPMLVGLFVAAVAIVGVAFTLPKLRSGSAGASPSPASFLIVRLAMIEAAAIFGLVAALIDRHWQVFVPFLILALGGFLAAYPSEAPAGSESAGE